MSFLFALDQDIDFSNMFTRKMHPKNNAEEKQKPETKQDDDDDEQDDG